MLEISFLLNIRQVLILAFNNTSHESREKQQNIQKLHWTVVMWFLGIHGMFYISCN